MVVAEVMSMVIMAMAISAMEAEKVMIMAQSQPDWCGKPQNDNNLF